MKQENQFIPFIHNYCDRWCERCQFVMRCRIGVEEVERLRDSDGEELEEADLIEAVADNLKKALTMLEKFAEEKGIDLEDLKNEIADIETPELTYTAEQDAIKEWGISYIRAGRDWFEENKDNIQRKENELNQQIQLGLDKTSKEGAELENAMEVIRWFLFFINVKTDRALHGLQSDWLEEEDPIQNDSNGSAKVALDAIERSLAAWEVVRKNFPDQIDELIDIFVLLGKMRKGLIAAFPKVHEFIRPGFDEPELYAVK